MKTSFPSVRELWWRWRKHIRGRQALLEEEKVTECAADRWYPVTIGETFLDQYAVLGKLGWGRTSTVWFCEDRSDNSYKVLKICIHEHDKTTREEKAYDAMRGLDATKVGGQYVRHILDEFDVQGPSGYWHHCFVFAPAACSVAKLMRATGPLSLSSVKPIMRNVLHAVDFLHNDVGLVHTDIKAANVLFQIENHEALESFAQTLRKHPPKPWKGRGSSRKIYRSVQMPNYGRECWGAAVLGDLGEARLLAFDELFSQEMVGAKALRAPETLLGMDWGHEIDIWMLGCMFLDLLTDEHLFGEPPGSDEWSDSWHLAQMVGLLGQPPADFCGRSELAGLYFDEEGAWKGADGWTVPQIPFEEKLAGVQTDEKTAMLNFVRGMMRWKPEERKTARELLAHPLLQVQATAGTETRTARG